MQNIVHRNMTLYIMLNTVKIKLTMWPTNYSKSHKFRIHEYQRRTSVAFYYYTSLLYYMCIHTYQIAPPRRTDDTRKSTRYVTRY